MSIDSEEKSELRGKIIEILQDYDETLTGIAYDITEKYAECQPGDLAWITFQSKIERMINEMIRQGDIETYDDHARGETMLVLSDDLMDDNSMRM